MARPSPRKPLAPRSGERVAAKRPGEGQRRPRRLAFRRARTFKILRSPSSGPSGHLLPAKRGEGYDHAAALGVTVARNLLIRYGPDRTGSYFGFSPGARHASRQAISANQFG